MTDFRKIRNYYRQFDEWSRLDTFAGQLELNIVLEIIASYIKPPSKILDLGGGAGRYTFELAQKGYHLDLMDLSPDLIAIACEKLKNLRSNGFVEKIEVANALNLTNVSDESYDNIMLFGPLYHLTTEAETENCIKEVQRILKPKGKIFTTFLPYHSGLVGILERSISSPEQVDATVIRQVHENGVFHNATTSGFQEGKFHRIDALAETFTEFGFDIIEMRSIRGIAYKNEKAVLNFEKTNPAYYMTVMTILHNTAADQSIVETCGHAIIILQKR